MKKKIIKLCFVLGWMILIFIFSNQISNDSTKLTNGILKTIIDLFNINEDFMNFMFIPLRKLAHFSEYLVLGILIINFIKEFNIDLRNMIIYSLLLCVIYAVSDEIHQLFISGRAGLITDVLIDTIGSMVGISIYYLFNKKRNSIKR